MASNINGSKQSVIINMENRPKGKFPKVKFIKMPSITDTYGKNLIGDDLTNNDLLRAISKNEVDRCRDILDECDDFLFSNDSYFHPLLLAAKKGRDEILQLLLNHGVDINVQDKKNFNALHYAIQQRNLKCCEILLDRNINVNVTDKFGNLPLHLAASEGILDIVQRLLNLSQNPNARNKKNRTPIHFACMKGNENILSLLLNSGERWDLKDTNYWLPIHLSAFHGHHKCSDILVEKSGDRIEELVKARNKEGATPLILAAKKGHSKSCQSLKSSDINAYDNKGNTALHLAASALFLKTVEVLIEMKPNVSIRNKDGNTAIHKAAMQKDSNCLKLLIEYSNIYPGINSMKQTVIHMAAINNSEECLKYLFSKPTFKTYINEQDKDGKTALHLALNQKHSEVSELLISNGINTNIQDVKDNTPLHIAAGMGMFSICKLLLSGNGVQRVNDKNVMGTTPLHLAAMNGSTDCCKLLLTKGADLNTIDSHGCSPSHIAANEGNLEVLKLFTRKGGGFINQVVEISGETCLHIAARKGYYKCCSFILKNMKKDTIRKLSDKENTALDEAYEAEQDKIFYLILSNIPYPKESEKNDNYNLEQYYQFQSTLHAYFHEAFESERFLVLQAIVESRWWHSGLSSRFCEKGQCQNLVNLTKKHPELTENVYRKCVQIENFSTKFDFQIFEDFNYLPLSTNTSDLYLKRESPFDPKTGRLLKDSVPYKKQGEHPLITATKYEHTNLMQHPLTEAYLNYKWVSYIRGILLVSVFLEVVTVLLLCLYLSFVRKVNEIPPSNTTNLCERELVPKETFEMIDPLWTKTVSVFSVLLISTVCIFISEMRWNVKTSSRFTFGMISAVQFYRVLGILILLIPVHLCSYDIIVKENWQWQIGIWTLLLSWFHMIQTFNSIPFLSVFMPFTAQFVKSFFKVLMYIVLIVFIFAFIFHLLLDSKDAFKTIPVAFIKTTVWVLGDLAYDDMFLDKDSPITYPIMTNIIFLLLVTTISGFIINMIIAQPTDHLDLFRERANYHKIASRIRLFLSIDTGFNTIKNKYLVSNITVEIVNKPKLIEETSKEGSSSEIDTYVSLLNSVVERLDRIEAQLKCQENKL